MYLLRIIRIFSVARRHGIDEMLVEHKPASRLAALCRALRLWRRNDDTKAVRIRRFLEDLGPISVKFGQVLSTRRDLLPVDIADELAKLQEHVPPFPAAQVHAQIEAAYGKPASEVFAEFDETPVASASVAQVHFARLRPENGGGASIEVAVKILRPDMEGVITHDLALLNTLARLVEMLWSDGRRLKPREIVAEFAKYLRDEFDLMREAANASQLRRNFKDSELLLIPEVYWDFCTTSVMVMDRMYGLPISHNSELEAAGVSLTELSRAGVEIFFAQVFRDGFFHADMHPGNIFVAVDGEDKGKYIALDFGIVGTLTETDKNYLARNFAAFFRRDYRSVVMAHVEAGWIPAGTRVDEFEAAIRAVCEPVFDRPLNKISFGKVLLRLFQTSRRFNVEIQPQLLMLQKTLLNVEGLGRQLDPNLDLWKIAKPFLERWMSEQIGWRAMLRSIEDEAPTWAHTLPQLPRLIHRSLQQDGAAQIMPVLSKLVNAQRRQNRLLTLIAALLLVWLAVWHFDS